LIYESGRQRNQLRLRKRHPHQFADGLLTESMSTLAEWAGESHT
jgi:hypothetical protein